MDIEHGPDATPARGGHQQPFDCNERNRIVLGQRWPHTTCRDREESAMHTTAAQPLDYASPEAMWEAFHASTREHTGRLFMAVRTTGIYCRPGCPARQPKRENVRFFASAAAAERVGFRACKRCRPNLIQPDPRVQLVEDVCRYLDEH